MEPRSYDNRGGKGLVRFERPRDEKGKTWRTELLVGGERIFEYGNPCGTCGVVFRKLASPKHRLDDAEVLELLGPLTKMPADSALDRLARVLDRSLYYPAILESRVSDVHPGSADDYFAQEVVRCFGHWHPWDGDVPGSPYYRLAPDHRFWWPTHNLSESLTLLTSIIMPLHDPQDLDRRRIDYWKSQPAAIPLTAMAVSVLDCQSPACGHEGDDPNFEFTRLVLFTHCLLDGHHRVHASAETGRPMRILTFLNARESILEENGAIAAALDQYAGAALDQKASAEHHWRPA